MSCSILEHSTLENTILKCASVSDQYLKQLGFVTKTRKIAMRENKISCEKPFYLPSTVVLNCLSGVPHGGGVRQTQTHLNLQTAAICIGVAFYSSHSFFFLA